MDSTYASIFFAALVCSGEYLLPVVGDGIVSFTLLKLFLSGVSFYIIPTPPNLICSMILKRSGFD